MSEDLARAEVRAQELAKLNEDSQELLTMEGLKELLPDYALLGTGKAVVINAKVRHFSTNQEEKRRILTLEVCVDPSN